MYGKGCRCLHVYKTSGSILLYNAGETMQPACPAFAHSIFFALALQLWAVLLVLRGAMTAAVVLAPYAAFQYFGYQRYCRRYSGPQRPWCDAAVPNLYGYVQSHYWNVGLFRYYELKQVGG